MALLRANDVQTIQITNLQQEIDRLKRQAEQFDLLDWPTIACNNNYIIYIIIRVYNNIFIRNIQIDCSYSIYISQPKFEF